MTKKGQRVFLSTRLPLTIRAAASARPPYLQNSALDLNHAKTSSKFDSLK
jgi:hypothetical protein